MNIIGAIAGDIIGSVFEWNNVKSTDFSLFNKKSDFTDDTVLTIAVADCILNNKDFAQYGNMEEGIQIGDMAENLRNGLIQKAIKPLIIVLEMARL